MRRRVFERDKGVCAKCGADTVALERQYRAEVRAVSRMDLPWSIEKRLVTWLDRTDPVASKWKAEGWPVGRVRDWWDADHIVEVVRGGGQCGLDNLQTLCYPCHQAKTRELAKARALERRLAKRQTGPQIELQL